MTGAWPPDLPLFPGFPWNEPYRQTDEGKEADVLESGFYLEAEGPDVEDFYKTELLEAGWRLLGPAGGSTSWTLSGSQGGRACRIYFTANDDFDTAAPLSSEGVRLRLVHWADGPASLQSI